MTLSAPVAGNGPRDPPPNALLPGSTIGDYEITRVIGEGGFGIVYAALDRALHRSVALKEYMPSALARRRDDQSVVLRSEQSGATFAAGLKSFVNEAELLAQFDHPALVKVLKFWEQNQTAYMAMPLYEGRTLRDVLRDHPQPDERWLKALLVPLLDALQVLHAAHCYHRDIAPDNILVLDDGNPVLLDFGAARRIIGDLAQGVTVILKPGFAPIEQYADDDTLIQGPWTDIYALAAVIRLAITGKAAATSVTRMVTDPVVPLVDTVTGYSREFLQAIDRGLAVRPENRPQSVADFRRALGIDAPANPGAATAAAAPLAEFPPAASVPAKPDGELGAFADSLGAAPLAGGASATGTNGPLAATDPALDETLPALAAAAPGTAVPVAAASNDVSDETVPATLQSRPGPTMPAPASPTIMRSTTATTGVRPPNSTKVVLFIAAALLAVIAVIVGVYFVTREPAPSIVPPAVPNVRPAPPAVAPPAVAPPAVAPPAVAPPVLPPPAPPEKTSLPEQAAAVPAIPGGAASTPPVQSAVPDVANDPRSRVSPDAAGSDSSATATASPVPAVSAAGRVHFDVKPWGEVFVDGKARGLSPPLKSLTLPEGNHRIEIRNPAARTLVKDIDLKSGRTISIAHTFQ